MKKIYIIILAVLLLVVITIVACLVMEDKKPGNNTEIESGFEVYERIDAPYEHWLAAAVITGIATEYPDFELVEIRAEGETSLSKYNESTGIYMIFNAEGEQKCIYSVPLEEERTETGTYDVKSTVIGYATFDEVPAEEIDGSIFGVLEIEDLNTLIEQSELITLLSR